LTVMISNQEAVLPLNLRFSYKLELGNGNNHQPFQWSLPGLFCQGNKPDPAAGVAVEPLMLPEQKHILLFTACSCWPHFHSL